MRQLVFLLALFAASPAFAQTTNCNVIGNSINCQTYNNSGGFGQGFVNGYSKFSKANTEALQAQNQQQQLRLQQQQLNQQKELIQQQQQMLNMMQAQQANPVEPKAPVEGLPWLEHK